MFEWFKSKPKVETRSIPMTEEQFGALGLSFLKKLYEKGDIMSLSAVFNAVEMISGSLSQLPIHIRYKETGELVSNHNIYTVIDNMVLTKFMLIKMLVSDMLLHGDGLAYISRADDGTPIDITYCEHGTYSINYNPISKRVLYNISCINKTVEDCDVIHLYKYSKNGYTGIGISQVGASVLDVSKFTEDAAKSFYESGCKIDGVLKSTKPLSDKQKFDIRQAWNQVHKNGNDGLVILGADMDYTAIGSTANEAQLLDTRLYNTTEVARLFNISPVLLQDLSKSSYNTIEASQLSYVIHTLAPYIILLEQEFTRKLLLPSERTILEIDFCEDEMLVADKQATASYLSTLVSCGIFSINESRHILHMKPIEGGDEHRIAYSDPNQNSIENTQNKNTEETQNEEQ